MRCTQGEYLKNLDFVDFEIFINVKGNKYMIVIISIVATICIVLFILLTRYFCIPEKDKITINNAKEYFINKTGNYFETQKKFECAGYATAYVLRELGIQICGDDLYNKIDRRLPFGFVSPKSILRYLQKNTIKAQYYSGTLKTLESRLQKGTSIIVLIKVFNNKNCYHYNVLTGFNETTMYFAESLFFLRNRTSKK